MNKIENKKILAFHNNIKNEVFSLDNDENLNEDNNQLFDIKQYYSQINNIQDNPQDIIEEKNEKIIKEIKELNTSIINNSKNLDTKSEDLNSSIESLCPKDTNIYLKLYDWKKYKVDEKEMKKIIIEVMNNDEIIEFKKILEKMNLTGPDCDEIILFSNIGYLKKYDNNNEICTKKKKQQEILMWRKIKGDGNCYFRSVMFAVIENSILNKNIEFLKKIIVNFFEKSKNKILITMFNGLNLDMKLVKKCFIMLYLSITSKSSSQIMKAYITFIKLINNYKDFDYGLILFFKFILYEYVNNNKNSTYSFKFQVLLGNLLPYDCQNNKGEFNFNHFYKNYLMKFYQYAEKIIIYLTPFIFGKEVVIKYINVKEDENINIQDIEFGKNISIIEFDENDKIQLLYKKSHYDILYTSEYYNKYKDILKYTLLDYINNSQVQKCQICKKVNEKSNILIKLESDIEPKNDIDKNDYEYNLYQKQSKNIIICYKCLYNEIKQNLMILYINHIKKIKKFFLDNIPEKLKDLLNKEFTLSNKKFNITYNQGIKTLSLYKNKYSFEYIINHIKSEICINCANSLNKKKLVTLPCKCNLCSDKCIKEFYYILLSSAYINKEFLCFCNTKYSIEYCLVLVEKLNEKKFDCKELIELLFDKIEKNICFLCSELIDNDYNEYLLIEPNFCLNRIIKHYLCKKCKNKNNNFIGQNIYCQICKRNHIIDKIADKTKVNIINGCNNNYNNKIDIKNDNDYNKDNRYNEKDNKKDEINFDDNNNEEEKVTIIKIHKKRKTKNN